MYKYISKVFYENDDFTITLEEADGNLMIHVAVYNFSKKILRQLLLLWEEICERAYWQGYEEIYTYSAEPRMFHFFKEGTKMGTFMKNGKEYEVVKWDLK